MSQILNTIEEFQNIWGSKSDDSFNIFFGAGVSKDPPTEGPIWTEMQTAFLDAVFDAMESEGWPAATNFPKDRESAANLDIRPEVFWRRRRGSIYLQRLDFPYALFGLIESRNVD